MTNTLQDQLRALGLVASEQKSTQGQKQASLPEKKSAQQYDGLRHQDKEPSLGEAYALREQDEQRQARQARQQRQQEEHRRRRINRAIREIVNPGRQNRQDAEIARHFLFNGRIRRIYVTPEQQEALNDNRLGIVYLSGGYHLLKPEALEAVRRISEDHVVAVGSDDGNDDEAHPVPEGLSW